MEPSAATYAFLDLSGCPFTSFPPETGHHLQNLDGVDPLAQQGSPNPLKGSTIGDDDGTIADLLNVEALRKKIEVLAAMVGMGESDEPAAVLGEVVKVLRELQRKAVLVANLAL
ncbi:hypothetical protein OPV22_031486 [Ensete ventricosum]|uniref:Mediator of RNA polymerase II transcription subunit 7 n=1 Tax=Ensete ventricosum TaxID=4639 RepID=A0AAV8P0K0_ENSVE|nr:hypothetical protein OPV22_031486 [Ensete ventricosum]